MAPEQLELQQLAEQWYLADKELENSRRSLDQQKYDVENKEATVNKLADVLKTQVGANLTHKLVLVDEGMGDHVLIEYVNGAHSNYATVRRLRTE